MPYDATDRFTPQLSLSALHCLTCGLFPAPDKHGSAFRYYQDATLLQDGVAVFFIIRRVLPYHGGSPYVFEAHTYEGPAREPITGTAPTLIEAMLAANAAAETHKSEEAA